jgi:hypothetical protein
MDPVSMTSVLPPSPAPPLVAAGRARPVAAGRNDPDADAGAPDVLIPPDPWTDALVAVALAAGRLRSVLAAADDDEWVAAMAGHALHLARRRARELADALTGGDGQDGRVTCWFP